MEREPLEEKDVDIQDEASLPVTKTVKTSDESIATEKTTEIKHGGLIIVLVFIALLLILIGLFYWHNSQTKPQTATPIVPERPTPETNHEPESSTARAQTASFDAMSTSDEINTIEADLESTNLDSLNVEMNAIEAELGSI